MRWQSAFFTGIAAFAWCFSDPFSFVEQRGLLALSIGVMTLTAYLPVRLSPWFHAPGLALLAFAFSQTPFPDGSSGRLALLTVAACGLLYLSYYPGPLNPLPRSHTLSRIVVLKNVTVALAWTLATLFVVSQEPPIHWVLHRFLFVFGLSLFADLRDTTRDQELGIITLASILGYNKTKWLAALVVFASGIMLLSPDLPSRPALLWSSTASFVCGTILLTLKQNIPERHVGPLIDGLMAITATGTMLATLV
ncbi:MAG: hypothetical protein ACKORE_11320 [Bacteroidota bacterium]